MHVSMHETPSERLHRRLRSSRVGPHGGIEFRGGAGGIVKSDPVWERHINEQPLQ
jgi:hypothetical protein